MSQLVPWLRDPPGGRVSAAVLQGGQLPGQEQRVGQQQVLYRPQVSVTQKYSCVEKGWKHFFFLLTLWSELVQKPQTDRIVTAKHGWFIWRKAYRNVFARKNSVNTESIYS